MASDAQSPLNETWDQIDRQFRFLIDRVLAQHGPDSPELSLVMTCPEYPDSPVIAAMQGFENVCGRPVQSIIGSNCRFLNKGMHNDPETLKELREIQSSPQAARQYMKAYPMGKQFLLLNVRPCRMLPEGTTMNFEDPDPSTLIYFYNCLTIFAIEIKHEGRKTVVFIGLQCILHNGMDMEAARTYTNHIQEALTHPHKGVRHIFYHWCRVALKMYHEFYKWSHGESGSSSPISQLGSGGSVWSGGMSSASRTAAYRSEFPFSSGAQGSSERSASRESPKNGWAVSSGTTTTAAGSGSQTQGTSASVECSGSQGLGSSGSQALGTSSGGGRTSDGSSSNGSEAADGAMQKSQDDVAAAEPGSIQHAKLLLDRVRKFERIAMMWEEDNEQEQRDSRVQDLVGLREALCDDFAADLELYLAYHSMQRETLQFEEIESHS